MHTIAICIDKRTDWQIDMITLVVRQSKWILWIHLQNRQSCPSVPTCSGPQANPTRLWPESPLPCNRTTSALINGSASSVSYPLGPHIVSNNKWKYMDLLHSLQVTTDVGGAFRGPKLQSLHNWTWYKMFCETSWNLIKAISCLHLCNIMYSIVLRRNIPSVIMTYLLRQSATYHLNCWSQCLCHDLFAFCIGRSWHQQRLA